MIPKSAIRSKETPRRIRVASEVKKVISEFLLRGAVSDPARSSIATMIAITGVDMSPDLQHAKVFFSSISPQISSEECSEFLENHKYKLRAHVGASIRLKHTPELRFLIDDSSEKAEKIENLLKKIAQK
jgi:ribosome-binding factor A